MDNIIFIEFKNKKNFPPGKWLKEPDICQWVNNKLSCLAVRDMSLGSWKGFVGVDATHPFYKKTIEEVIDYKNMIEIYFSIHGGICSTGFHFPRGYTEFNNNLWWIGIETSHGGDLMPLLSFDEQSNQTYKDLLFIRKEINKLAKYISKLT